MATRMFTDLFIIYIMVTLTFLALAKGGVINHHVCEQSTVHLECPSGQTISALAALYGRQTSSLCTNGPNTGNTNCATASALTVVQQRCNGRRTCDIQASNGVFGDPCVGTFKYLEIQYSCEGPAPIHACEHNNLHMSCAVGKSINVNTALYGRQTSAICTSGPIYNLHCASSNSLQVVRQQCNGRRTCSIGASNSVFGDPCVGTFKYLQVGYSCV